MKKLRALPLSGDEARGAGLNAHSMSEASQTERSIYTCPMHPEVRRPGPGACPICGMALEPVVAAPKGPVTQWVCPMHPEVIREQPGSCPICGMALEPRAVTAVEEANPELADMSRRFWIGLALTVPIVALETGTMLLGQPLAALLSARTQVLVQLVLATPVVLWAGWPLSPSPTCATSARSPARASWAPSTGARSRWAT